MDDHQRIVGLCRKITQCELHANQQHPTYDNLLQWGAALMELSNYEDADGAVKSLQAAIVHLNEASQLEIAGHHVLWCLGCAHALLVERTPKGDIGRQIARERSVDFFRQAEQLDPGNELYRRSNQSGVQAFFMNKFMWGSVGAAVLVCISKFAFEFARKKKK